MKKAILTAVLGLTVTLNASVHAEDKGYARVREAIELMDYEQGDATNSTILGLVIGMHHAIAFSEIEAYGNNCIDAKVSGGEMYRIVRRAANSLPADQLDRTFTNFIYATLKKRWPCPVQKVNRKMY